MVIGGGACRGPKWFARCKNAVTGEGLGVFKTAPTYVVVKVSHSPSFDDDPAMQLFTASTTNLVSAGVAHYVAVPIVDCDQEIRYSIVRATRFVEFADALLHWRGWRKAYS